ncbi:YaaL family protein [Paenibacillus sp. MSJ-6]|uniref:YaaL family protein n=2 Tax=Paenibacillus brevis TaxID=2841508 RepID=A0ABS6FVX2_9BACL|nr:DUF2508 family protein [Paenibacillus brevis]MBU5674249.1 YaaL family protein [Paenibacillus brevis]
MAQANKEVSYKVHLYDEVMKARAEWELASHAFQYALGKDEVDVAIYTLEAAERKYQIKLKQAKQANVHWEPFGYGDYVWERKEE